MVKEYYFTATMSPELRLDIAEAKLRKLTEDLEQMNEILTEVLTAWKAK